MILIPFALKHKRGSSGLNVGVKAVDCKGEMPLVEGGKKVRSALLYEGDRSWIRVDLYIENFGSCAKLCDRNARAKEARGGKARRIENKGSLLLMRGGHDDHGGGHLFKESFYKRRR